MVVVDAVTTASYEVPVHETVRAVDFGVGGKERTASWVILLAAFDAATAASYNDEFSNGEVEVASFL
ncbi:MAG: hypothetical protein PVJ39_10105 [Gammaproteobacteria bacterium]|jgi:hypothetical protein